MQWIVGCAADLNVAVVAYTKAHRPVGRLKDIDRFAHQQAKQAASDATNRPFARGSIVAAIGGQSAAESASSTSLDPAIEDGAVERVDGPPEHNSPLDFYCGEAREKPLRHAPHLNPLWPLGYDRLFSRRIFHILQIRSTGDIPSYAPLRGAVDDKGNITSWPLSFHTLQELHFQVEIT